MFTSDRAVCDIGCSASDAAPAAPAAAVLLLRLRESLGAGTGLPCTNWQCKVKQRSAHTSRSCVQIDA